MTVYTAIPQDDSNLDVQVTEAPDLVEINIQPAAFTGVSSGDVQSVNGQTGVVVLDSDDIDEGDTNLYYTQGRFDTAFGDKTTTDLTEGTNQYYTDARVNTFLTDGSVTSINFGGNTSLSWNNTDQTLDMPLNGVTIQIGQEQVALVLNNTGATILNGSVVRITGAQGNRMTAALANNTDDSNSATVLGVATQDILNNQQGFVTLSGLVRDIDTSSLTEGSAIYLGVAGTVVDTMPQTPLHTVLVGYCVRSHATVGSIFVHVQNGYELSELHDVLITNVANNDLIAWDTANGYWKNITNNYATTDQLFSGDYNDLTNQPTIPTVPTNVSAFTNDAGYLTAETDSQTLSFANPNLSISNGNTVDLSGLTPDLTGYATESYVDTAKADAISAANAYTLNQIGMLDIPTATSDLTNDSGFITGYTETDPVFQASVAADITQTDIDNWNNPPAGYTDADVDAHLNTSAATSDQVLSWNGADYAWVDQSGGGGGASSLDDLTDVSIVSVSDGDMLIYNGTAGEWQNTNLGISVTPIVTMDSEFYAGLTATATITNYNTYDDPNFWAQVKDSGGTVVVTNSEITDNNDGTISFVTPSVGTDYTLEVRVQDFGDVASEIATQNFNSIATPTHRYYRITFKNATSYNMIDRVQFYTGSNQTGTLYPTSAMTGYTTPSPYVASADKSQSGYDAWEAFNNTITGIGGSWWNLGSSSYANSWLQIDMGASVQINSFRLNPVASGGYVNTAGWYIWSSDTGAFAGEEVLRAEIDYISGTYEYTVG